MDERYSLSFSTSSIRQQESLKLVILYNRYKEWKLVRAHVIERNVLQQRTTTSSAKLFQELTSRLRHLSDAEISYLAGCPESEKSIMLWVATCRRYRFIRDFTIEVLWENQRNLINEVKLADFDVFYSSKRVIHEELDETPDSTRLKVRQILFRMLREVGLLTRDHNIRIFTPNAETVALLGKNDLQVIGIYDEAGLSSRAR